MKTKQRSVKAEYDAMKQEHPLGWFCWACGRSERDKPRDWFAPWFIHRSHIVNSPRVDDRRAVVLLCPGCHATAHGERLSGWDLPKLSLANMLWLKKIFDPKFYERKALQNWRSSRLPAARKPPQEFIRQTIQRRGSGCYEFCFLLKF